MSVAFRKSRMISFRLSDQEYETLARICAERGMRSISDMARIALQHLAADGIESDPLTFEVRDLRCNLKILAQELERLSEIVEGRKYSKAAG